MIRCETCRRHHFETEVRCPFCAKAPSTRLRSGLIAAGLTVLAGCPIAPAYGLPPERDEVGVDAQSQDAAVTDGMVADGAPASDGSTDAPILPPYGIPPDFAPQPDAARDAAVDMPIAQPPYGIPPEPDAQVPDAQVPDAAVDQGDTPDMPGAVPPYGVPPGEG